jgi:polyribonucleotide nucleotidyltransferase
MPSYWFDSETVAFEVGGREMSIETGRLAKQAAGAALVTCGETVVLVTATHSDPRPGIDFFPLVVDFVEKTSSAGKIPGGFFKREGRLSDREVLVSRFIDRSLRPLFAEGYRDETQIIATVLSADGQNAPDVAAFIGASAALTISEIPFLGPIGAVRVGRVGGQFVVNPLFEQFSESDMNVIVAGSRSALVMVEGSANEVSEAETLEALKLAHGEIVRCIDVQEDLVKRVGKTKISVPEPTDHSELERAVRAKAESRLGEALRTRDKGERYRALAEIESAVLDEFVTAYRNEPAKLDTLAAVEQRQQGLREVGEGVKHVLHELRSECMRKRILDEGVRIDGRGLADIRPIACEVRPIPRPHGVALFTRGETQAIVFTTLGGSGDEQTIDALTERTSKRFYLHYNFPPFSVGEARMHAHATRPRPPRGGSRKPGRAGPVGGSTRPRRVPVHDPHRLRDVGVERVVVHGDGVRRHALADGRGCAAAGAGGGHRHGAHRGGRPRRDSLRHPGRRGSPRRHGFQGRWNA